MEQITRSGIPILDGLRDLRDGMENPRFREILTSVIEDMEGGKMLSQALAGFPTVFNTVFVSLVRAGEQPGHAHRSFREPRRNAEMAGRAGSQTQAAADLSRAWCWWWCWP